MYLETANTYEASWYLMNGAVLVRIDIDIVENGNYFYKIVLDIREPRFIYYWQKGTPIGNIKHYMITRVQLKRLINERKNQFKQSQLPQTGV